MINCKKLISLSLALIFVGLLPGKVVLGQGGTSKKMYPVPGKPCPDFVISNIEYLEGKERVRLSDFRGKWLILDFFSKGCSSCFASFSKLSQLQMDLKPHVQVLLIGKNDGFGSNIRDLYEKFRTRQGLKMAVAYDTSLFVQFGVRSMPHVVIVNPNGVVEAVTDGISEENMVHLIKNEPVSFKRRYNFYEGRLEKDVDLSKPFLIDDNGGENTDFLYRSVFYLWNPGMRQRIYPQIDAQVDKGMFQGAGLILRWLYNYAYVGASDWSYSDSLYLEYNRFPIVETKDSLLFEPDFETGKGVFNYSLILPREKANREYLQSVMRRDLKNYFGHDVSVEWREVPCWSLETTESVRRKLRTKGGRTEYIGDPSVTGFEAVNIPIGNILSIISSYHQDQVIFLDNTYMSGNVDFKLDAIMTDFQDIKRALYNQGLNLVRRTCRVKVLVIRDSGTL